MAVTPDDVRHVAQLARLAIPEDVLASYVEQLNGILTHMEALQAVSTVSTVSTGDASPGGAPGDERPGIAMRLRDDELGSVPLARSPQEFAPAMREGFFLVPRLATHEAGEES